MPEKKVMVRANDYDVLDNAFDELMQKYDDSKLNILRVRIEDNLHEIVLSLKGDSEELIDVISSLKKTPALKLEEI